MFIEIILLLIIEPPETIKRQIEALRKLILIGDCRVRKISLIFPETLRIKLHHKFLKTENYNKKSMKFIHKKDK